jgi:hypothetical protein
MDEFYEQLEKRIESQRSKNSRQVPAIGFNIDYKRLPTELKPIALLLEPLAKASAQFKSGGLFQVHNENRIVELDPTSRSPNLNVIVIPFDKFNSHVIGYFRRGVPEKGYFLMTSGHQRYHLSLSELKNGLVEELGSQLVNLGLLNKDLYSKKVQDTIGID